jgi:hypothetical protein
MREMVKTTLEQIRAMQVEAFQSTQNIEMQREARRARRAGTQAQVQMLQGHFEHTQV